jgi:indole-3-glycerol phosphate synthase
VTGGGRLARIIEDKRRRLASESFRSPAANRTVGNGDGFLRSLRDGSPRVIAELKARSPSAGEILRDADDRVEALALAYARGGAAAISVVTEEDHFGGKPEWIPRVKRATGLPVLMKDFFLSERQLDEALALGADAVLLIVAALEDAELRNLRAAARERGLAVIAEAHGPEEIPRAGAVDPDVLGINARDLRTFRTDLTVLLDLSRELPAGPVRLAESGITSRADVARLSAAGYEAFLVGEALLRAEDPETTLRALLR